MTTGQKVLLKAMEYNGLTEVPGAPSNDQILRMIKAHIPNAKDDSRYGWCGIFIAFVFKQLGMSHLIPNVPVTARNWSNLTGTEIQIEDAKQGDIVVFWRGHPSSWKGHVAIYNNESSRKGYINVLGGNQSNQVAIKPYAKSRILVVIRLE